jgi:hypothetical protein
MERDRHDSFRIGFGLGRLHHVPSRKMREKIVLGALDAGMTHFDMAAAYGDGLVEAEAGRILHGKRSRITLATKFGIPTGTLGARNIPLYFVSKALRKAFHSRYGQEYGLRDFSPDAAVRGLEESLKRLRTDHVDWLFFHEPRHARDFDAVLKARDAMERLKDQGKIRAYGVSACPEFFLDYGAEGIVGERVQFELNEHSSRLLSAARTARASAYGLIRHLRKAKTPGRLDYGEVLAWFFDRYPTTMPILASNRPDEIARLGRALAGLSRYKAKTA